MLEVLSHQIAALSQRLSRLPAPRENEFAQSMIRSMGDWVL